MENHGKSWENHGKIMENQICGKSWKIMENHRKSDSAMSGIIFQLDLAIEQHRFTLSNTSKRQCSYFPEFVFLEFDTQLPEIRLAES